MGRWREERTSGCSDKGAGGSALMTDLRRSTSQLGGHLQGTRPKSQNCPVFAPNTRSDLCTLFLSFQFQGFPFLSATGPLRPHHTWLESPNKASVASGSQLRSRPSPRPPTHKGRVRVYKKKPNLVGSIPSALALKSSLLDSLPVLHSALQAYQCPGLSTTTMFFKPA